MNNKQNFQRLTCYLFLSLAAFFTFTPSFAADGGWATVDTRILLMLHPQMNGFDYSNGRFFRNPDEKNIDKTITELKTAHEKSQKECAPLMATQKKLLQQRFELLQQQARDQKGFAPGDIEKYHKEKSQLQASLDEVNRQKPADRDAESLFAARKADLHERLKIINNKLSGYTATAPEPEDDTLKDKIDKINKQLKELGQQIQSINEKSVASVYLTTEESEKRLATIKKEINDLIKKAADESKIAMVIDNSFAMRNSQRKERLKMIPATDEAPDVVSSSLFHSFNNLSINPEIAAITTGPDNSPLPPEHLVVGRSIGMQSNLTQYLEFRNYMPEKVADFSHGRLIISGGNDLTAWVARQLFDRYKIPESIKNSFMLAVRNYLNFDKEPATRERDY
jgi:gas vesicle protein